MNNQTPETKIGWLKKKSREGIMRNWKRRFFVLESGALKYYEKKISDYSPYGDVLKGECDLSGATAVLAAEHKFADQGNEIERQRRVVIKTSDESSDKDLLIEAEDQDDAADWVVSIREHCKWASANACRNGPRRTSDSNARESSMDGDDGSSREARSLSASRDNKTISPVPGIVLKTRRVSDGTKVFVNICSHIEVPTANAFKGSARWPFMLASTCREFTDKDSKYAVYDIVVHTSVIKDIEEQTDEAHQLRDSVCEKALRRLLKQCNEELERNYTIPKSNKGYKGEGGIPPISLSSEDVTSARRSSVVKALVGVTHVVAKTTGLAPMKEEDEEEEGDGSARGSPATSMSTPGGVGTSTTRKQSVARGTAGTPTSDANSNGGSQASAAKPSSASRLFNDSSTSNSSRSSPDIRKGANGSRSSISANNAPRLPRKTIPFAVLASQGVALKADPSKFIIGKTFSRGVTVVQGDTLKVIGRIVTEGGVALLRTADGWVQEKSTPTISNKESIPMVLPKLDDKIVSIKINRYSVGLPKASGWSWWPFSSGDSKKFRLILYLELQLPRDQIIRVARDLSEIKAIKEAISNTNLQKKMSFITFPAGYCELEGTDEFVNDLQTFLAFLDALEEWLAHILRKPEFTKLAEVQKFITPNADDVTCMQMDLMAVGGLGGAYVQEMLCEAP